VFITISFAAKLFSNSSKFIDINLKLKAQSSKLKAEGSKPKKLKAQS